MNKTLWVKVKDVSWTKLGDQMLILDGKRLNLVHELNEVATFIWEQLDKSISIDEIEVRVFEEFEVDAEVAKKDILEFFELLKNNQLIEEVQSVGR